MKLKFLLFILLVPQIAFAYYVRHPCCSRLQPYGWWGSIDYIFLWRKTHFFPPLATTNPTTPPVLSDPTTTILFGDEELGGSPKSGVRGDFGIWFTKCVGFGTSICALGKEEINFNISGINGSPILGRPFFNTITGTEDVSLVSFPSIPLLSGSIDIDSSNRLWGFDIYARHRFFCSPCFKFDWLAGFQYGSVTDSLNVSSTVSELVSGGVETTIISDQFECENDYYAGMVGLAAEWRSRNWAFTVTGKVGLGNMHKNVEIAGSTTISAGGTATITTGGLLAQPSNIGSHKNTKFEVVPQASANLQLRLCPHLWATLGYTYMFWPAVDFAGEQVNLDINPTQTTTLVGTPSPFFHEKLKSFWAQGITAGFYFCY